MESVNDLDVARAHALEQRYAYANDDDDEDDAKDAKDGPPEFAFDDDSNTSASVSSSASSAWTTSDDDDDDDDDEDASETSETEAIDRDNLPSWLKAIKDGVDEHASEGESASEDATEAPRTKNERERERAKETPAIGDDEAIDAIGVVASVVGDVVVIQSANVGDGERDPLDEDSTLCLRDRRGLGLVEEVFGPVSSPFYSVRLPSKATCANVPDVSVGDDVFVVVGRSRTVQTKGLYRKGYDASGKDDEEVEVDAEFSDDEAEAEAKRAAKPPKTKKRASSGAARGTKPARAPVLGGGGMFGMRGLPRPPPPPPPPSLAMGQMGIHQGQPMMMVPVQYNAQGQPMFVMPTNVVGQHRYRPPPPPPPPRPN